MSRSGFGLVLCLLLFALPVPTSGVWPRSYLANLPMPTAAAWNAPSAPPVDPAPCRSGVGASLEAGCPGPQVPRALEIMTEMYLRMGLNDLADQSLAVLKANHPDSPALDPNGNAYKFMLWAGDGSSTNSADTFRIRIWWEDAAGEHDMYDNGVGQPIAGGSIVVHTKK